MNAKGKIFKARMSLEVSEVELSGLLELGDDVGLRETRDALRKQIDRLEALELDLAIATEVERDEARSAPA
jgi:hypothetical protein